VGGILGVSAKRQEPLASSVKERVVRKANEPRGSLQRHL